MSGSLVDTNVLSEFAQRGEADPAVKQWLIAVTALEHGLTVVTRNVKDFSDFEVPILNPWETPAS